MKKGPCRRPEFFLAVTNGCTSVYRRLPTLPCPCCWCFWILASGVSGYSLRKRWTSVAASVASEHAENKRRRICVGGSSNSMLLQLIQQFIALLLLNQVIYCTLYRQSRNRCRARCGEQSPAQRAGGLEMRLDHRASEKRQCHHNAPQKKNVLFGISSCCWQQFSVG